MGDKDERYVIEQRDVRATAAIIRRCYGVSAREAERRLRLNDGDLDATLDELGESDESPEFTQHDAIRTHLAGLSRGRQWVP